MNYCQAGRHFFELFLAQDEITANEHILPLRRASADTYLWFGPNSDKDKILLRQEKTKDWFEPNKTRFNVLGLSTR